MSRRLAAAAGLLAAALSVSVASAQTQSTKPASHAGTQLTFPASVGGATLERSVNYAGPPANRPDQGIRYFYSTPKKMVIGVHLYDGGRRVPSGRLSTVATAPSVSAKAITAPPCRMSGRVQSSGLTTISAVTPVSLAATNFSPSNLANGSGLSFRS